MTCLRDWWAGLCSWSYAVENRKRRLWSRSHSDKTVRSSPAFTASVLVLVLVDPNLRYCSSGVLPLYYLYKHNCTPCIFKSRILSRELQYCKVQHFTLSCSSTVDCRVVHRRSTVQEVGAQYLYKYNPQQTRPAAGKFG